MIFIKKIKTCLLIWFSNSAVQRGISVILIFNPNQRKKWKLNNQKLLQKNRISILFLPNNDYCRIKKTKILIHLLKIEVWLSVSKSDKFNLRGRLIPQLISTSTLMIRWNPKQGASKISINSLTSSRNCKQSFLIPQR